MFFLFRLEAADLQAQECLEARRRSNTLPPAYDQWLNEHSQEVAAGTRRRRHLSWQAVATKIVQQPALTSIHVHFRRRLDKCTMHALPGHRVARAVRILQRLNRPVAPRWVAAFIRSICDGWATHARFQGVAACRFGCGVGRDSLSHIVKRPRTLEWCERYSQLRRLPLGEETDYFSA